MKMSVLATHLSSKHTFVKVPQSSITLLQGLGIKGDVHAGKKTQHEYYIKVDTRKGTLRDNIRQVHLIQSELFDEEGFYGKDGERLRPGQMGENITTIGIDLLALGKGTKLRFVETLGEDREVENSPKTKKTLLGGLLAGSCFVVIVVAVRKAIRISCIAGICAIVALLISCFVYQTLQASKGEAPVVVLTGRRRPCKKIDEYVREGLTEKCTMKDENNKIIGHRAGVMGIVVVGGVVRPSMGIVVEPADVYEELPAI